MTRLLLQEIIILGLATDRRKIAVRNTRARVRSRCKQRLLSS